MWSFLYRLASPRHFYQWSGKAIPWLVVVTVFGLVYGVVGGLLFAPADYQQGDAFRMIYVHVPSAFCSLMVYGVMSFMAVLSLIWRLKLADVILQTSAPLGASFTLLALVTGSLWGRPMWGTWWIWDARLTSELILLFIYLGIMGLAASMTDKTARARALALVVLIGALDLPIIHYSVVWWHSLHQGATLRLLGPSLIDDSMLYPLLAMLVAFISFYGQQLLSRARQQVVLREWHSQWVRELVDVA